jgi:hypothetical protein
MGALSVPRVPRQITPIRASRDFGRTAIFETVSVIGVCSSCTQWAIAPPQPPIDEVN